MGLPLPKVIPDVGPGGGLVTAMGGMNALSQAMLDTKMKQLQNQYAPLTLPAKALSEMAYASFVQPQYTAKLLEHPDIAAQLTPNQRAALLARATGAANNQNTLINLPSGLNNNNMNMPSPSQPTAFQGTNIPFGPQPQIRPNGTGFNPSEYNANNNPNSYSSNNLNNPPQNGNSNIPISSQNYLQNIPSQNMQLPINEPTQNTWAENIGRKKGIEKELEQMGANRANDIKDLSDVVFSGKTKQATLDNISQIISSPAFEQIRQTPILGGKELAYFQRYGTPDQQNMVGQLMTLSGNIIKDSARDFAGQFRKGEQQLLENMKINPSDTFNAMRGKMEQLSYLNQMITQRSTLTGQIMSQYHMNKLEAQEIADKQLNGDKLRSQIHNQLNPQPTEEDINHMAEKYKISTDEVKKRLKNKGYTIAN